MKWTRCRVDHANERTASRCRLPDNSHLPSLGASSKHPIRLAGQNQPPLLGFVSTPFHRHHRPLWRFRVGCRHPASVSRDHRKTRFVHVVSHHLDALHRERLASVLQPAADRRVRRVSRCRRAGILPKQSRSCDAIPATRFVPSEESPSSVAVLRHRSLCLLAVRCAHPKPPKRDQGHRRPGWAPIRRSESPHTRPSAAEAETGRQTVATVPAPSPELADSRRVGFEAFLHRRVRIIVLPLPAADDLSFHGLCSPSRYPSHTLNTRRVQTLGEPDASVTVIHREAPVRPGDAANREPGPGAGP